MPLSCHWDLRSVCRIEWHLGEYKYVLISAYPMKVRMVVFWLPYDHYAPPSPTCHVAKVAEN